MTRFPFLFIAGLISACASEPYPITSSYFEIPAGSHLILKQDLSLNPHTGRIYIQYGKIVSKKERDQYYPHCWFVSWDIPVKTITIKADKFIITASKRSEDLVSRQQIVLLASSNIAALSGVSYGLTAIEYSTILTIHSDTQPNIRQFICSHWEDPADAYHLTVSQINKALGDIAFLNIP